MGVFLGGTYYCKYKRNYSGLLSLAPPQDSAGECDSEAKRRHSQDRGKPCPYYTRRRLGRPARRIVGVPLAGTLARFPLSFASKVRRRGEGEGRGHPAPRQGALQAPWNPLLHRYIQTLYGPFSHMYPGET